MNIISVNGENHRLSIVITNCPERNNPAKNTITTTIESKKELVEHYQPVAGWLIAEFIQDLTCFKKQPGLIVITAPSSYMGKIITDIPDGETHGLVFFRKATPTHIYPTELLGKIWEYELGWIVNLSAGAVKSLNRTEDNNKLTVNYFEQYADTIIIERKDAGCTLTYGEKEIPSAVEEAPLRYQSYLLPAAPSFIVSKNNGEVSLTACDCDDKRMYEALLKSSDAFHNAYSKLTGDIAHNVLCVTMANVDAIREVAPWVNDCIHVFAVFVRQPHPNRSQKISDEQTYKLAWVFDHDDCYTSKCDGERFLLTTALWV